MAAWLEHWLENIARPNLRETSYDAYRVALQTHLIPAWASTEWIGSNRSTWSGSTASSFSTGHGQAQVHRTMRTALGEALRRGHVARNVAAIAKPPPVQVESV